MPILSNNNEQSAKLGQNLVQSLNIFDRKEGDKYDELFNRAKSFQHG
jgi:hypothetical protein